MSQKVYIAMMSRDRPEIETSLALVTAMRDIEKAGGRMTLKYVVRDSIISKTRNQFVADFLASDCTDLIMLDDDVVWEPKAIQRLLSHDCDVVGGVYPKRRDPLEFPVRRLPGASMDLATGLMEVKFLPTGFLRMTRSCLERMTEYYSDLAYKDDDAKGGKATALFWFDLYPDPDTGEITVWGEDFTFCRRWRDMGGQVFLDTLLRFKHMGRKAYEGCYAESLPVSEVLLEAAE